MNPDNTKISDCHNYVTDSTNPDEIRCCCCGQVCTWHVPDGKEQPPVPVLAIPISETIETTTPEVKTPPVPTEGQVIEEIGKDLDFQPDHKREFEYYTSWRSLPPLATNQSDETLVAMGIEPWMIEIMKIKTQKEFAEKYGISENTLSTWNKQLDKADFDSRFGWAKHLSRNAIMALYRSLLKKGSADQIKIWFQLVEGWIPKTETKIEDSRETTKLRNKLSDIMEEWTDDKTDEGISDGGTA